MTKLAIATPLPTIPTRKSTYRPNCPSVKKQAEQRNLPRKVARVTPQQIRHLRAQMGWTQKQLADRLMVDLITVSRWERGARVPISKYQKVLRRWCGLDEPIHKVPEAKKASL